MKKFLSIMIILTLVISLIGCGSKKASNDKSDNGTTINNNVESDSKDQAQNDNSDNENESIQKKKVELYFSDDQAMYLKKEEAEVDEVTAGAVLNKIIEGPKDSNHYATLPEKTKILDVKVENNIAYVNFDSSIRKLLGGGSATETMAIYSIVDTLAMNKQLNVSKVQFLIDGKVDASLNGHMDISKPVEPDLSMIK